MLTKRWLSPDAWKLDVYERLDGYAALRKALEAHPDDLIQLIKDSGLRGRGGAGFPTGMKWGFIPQNDGKPHYLVVNADEGEPGTCKDLPLMMADPHSLIEGVIIATYAIRANLAFIYIRGEAVHAARRLRQAVADAYAKGYLGTDILGSGFDLDLVVHSGAGAYICGEETALLDSLEGYRGQPRLRPPFPATARPVRLPDGGQQRRHHRERAVHRARRRGVVEEHGHREVARPEDLLAVRPGRQPGPVRVRAGHHAARADRAGRRHAARAQPEVLDAGRLVHAAAHRRAHRRAAGLRGRAGPGTMLGTTAMQIFSDQDCPVYATYRWIEFYHHESCGKCTPCREGNYWMVGTCRRILSGEGTHEDLDTLLDACDNLLGRSFCALGDGAASPVISSIKFFEQDYLDYIEGRKRRGCPQASW